MGKEKVALTACDACSWGVSSTIAYAFGEGNSKRLLIVRVCTCGRAGPGEGKYWRLRCKHATVLVRVSENPELHLFPGWTGPEFPAFLLIETTLSDAAFGEKLWMRP